MKFWDSSALMPLLIREKTSQLLRQLLADDSSFLFVWWGSELECVSALARRERDSTLDTHAFSLALARLRQLAEVWHEIDPSDAVRETALRLIRVHSLRSTDSLQLAAAFMAAEQRPRSFPMVTLDSRLANAARKEGFDVIGSTAE